jgi:type IV pilus assembly protein PilY1
MNRKLLRPTSLRRLLAVTALCLGTSASAIDLADTPLFLTVDIPPNLILTLDDSGSMSRAFTPDLCGNPNDVCDNNPDSRLNHRYVKSAHFNPLFYNPNIKYEIPKDVNGNNVNAGAQTSFTAAYINGFDPNYGSIDLSNGYRPSAGLHISSAGTKNHRFMNHYLDADNSKGDVRCKSGNPNNNRCQYSTDRGATNGNWNNMTSSDSCGGSTATCQSRTMPAYYYVFDTGVSGCSASDTADKQDNSCYKMVVVGSSSGTGTQDLNGDGSLSNTDKDERLNFAIWYSYYRTRNLMTISAAARAFANVPATTRVGWQGLGTCRGGTSTFVTSDCEGWQDTSTDFTNAIRPFTGTHRSNFYSWLFRLPMVPGTPLRTGLKRTGDYLTVNANTVATLTDTPYDHFTESYPSEFLPISCRKNFHIVMTDGVWGDSITTGNYDNTTTTLPESKIDDSTTPPTVISSYTARAPFLGSASDTLADIAFRYWITDLSSGGSGLANTIIETEKDRSGSVTDQYWNPVNNPATWQHMVNFTVGLGLTPFLDAVNMTYGDEGYGGSYPAIKAGTTTWPAVSSDGGKVADLWHAAINSRGKFFSADDPEALNEAFSSIIRSVSAETPSAASLAANSTQWQEGSTVFQAKFNSADWSGNFLALPVSSTGAVGTAHWDAANLLPAVANRVFYTLNGSTKQAVTCSGNGDFQTALNAGDNRCSDRLNWLKGATTHEARFYNATTNPNATFRNRLGSKLGDIINSDPMYVHKGDYGYHNSSSSSFTEKSSYAAFIANFPNRLPVVYVGGNDGMLHAFRADTGVTGQSGKELFAYIPKGVYANLADLTSQSYNHRYYVDGAPMAGDAYFDSDWHTVLVGGLNAGGKTIYALDITDPANFSASSILWEYADANDLGYTYAQPQIGRLNNGQWVAIFGNGYNSTNGNAYLYVVNLETGALLAKIAAGTEINNGLSTPVLWDNNGDKIIDIVYAGDLKGNLWKFDLTAASSTSWVLANGALPLFTAERTAGVRQPITAQPKVSAHPMGGTLVLFGTGQYLGDADLTNNDIQSFYAIRDSNLGSTVNRSQLQAQTIDQQVDIGVSTIRVTSSNTVDYSGSPAQHGWYMDLVFPASATTGGERIVSTSSFLEDRVIFTTITPSRDPCQPGGTSWLMEVLTLTGQRPTTTVLDSNFDNSFTSVDNYGGLPVSGVASTIGMIKVPAIIKKDGTAFKILTGTSGGFMTVTNKITPPAPGTINQLYWRQIQ